MNKHKKSTIKITRAICLSIVCSFVCVISNAQKNKLVHKDAPQWFSFKWYGDSVSGRYFDKLAILLPVKIDNINANFMAQFDLGASETVLYGNTLKNYYPGRAFLYSLLDTLHPGTSDAGVVIYPSKKIALHIGNYTTKDVLFFENYGDEVPKDSLFTSSEKHIGTIGADFTKNKVLIIDYPNHKMCLLDTMTKYWSSRAVFVNCKVKNNRIQLPLTINEQVHWIMFDTGASIFPLSTNKQFWESTVDPDAKVDTLKVNSWGEKVRYYGAPIRSAVYLGKFKLSPQKAWYTENQRLLDFNKGEGITGTTGNAYFFDNVVIIDFRNNRFGIVKQEKK